MLPCKKIYIDTKHKTTDSISNNNFRWELPETLSLPHNTIFYVDDICIPHSWYTIEANVNDRLYMQLTNNHTTVGTKINDCNIVTLSPGNYTLDSLAAEIKAKINDSYSLTIVNVTANSQLTNTITITPTTASDLMKILTDSDLATGMAGVTVTVSDGVWGGHWMGANYDHKNPLDINGLINNTSGASTFFSAAAAHVTGYVDLEPIKNIYMYNTNLGTFKTIGCKGEVTIIKKIPVTAGPHQMIFSNVTSSSDWLDCSRQTLKTLQFELKDSNDNNINFHGSHVSFSLSFDKYREVE
jgi:hypothetical protein